MEGKNGVETKHTHTHTHTVGAYFAGHTHTHTHTHGWCVFCWPHTHTRLVRILLASSHAGHKNGTGRHSGDAIPGRLGTQQRENETPQQGDGCG